MNILGNVEAFFPIFEGSTTPNTPHSLTIRVGEASLKPRMSEWFGLLETLHIIYRLWEPLGGMEQQFRGPLGLVNLWLRTYCIVYYKAPSYY